MTLSWFDRRRARPAAPRDAAVQWAARRRLGLTSPAEDARFQAWLADPANAAAYAEADAPVEMAGDLAGADEILALREAALTRYPAKRSAAPVWALVAAALIALVAAGGWAWLRDRPTAAAPIEVATGATAPTAGRRYASAVGERLSVRLDDGSRVTLNTASLIEVAYDGRQRLVRLLQGQALFEVAKHQSRPFIVAAGDRRITATGTAFDVRLDQDRVKVLLIEGRVVVDPLRRAGLSSLMPIDRQVLSPGEALNAAPGRTVSVAAADIDRETAWNRGQLVFRDTRLADAVAEMNRYGATPLVIEDPRIAELRISGVFATARPENFQSVLTAFYPLVVTPRGVHAQVLAWRDGAAADAAR